MGIYFDIYRLENRRQDERKSMRKLSLELTDGRRASMYRELVGLYDGGCESMENAKAILRWYGDYTCVEYCPSYLEKEFRQALHEEELEEEQ